MVIYGFLPITHGFCQYADLIPTDNEAPPWAPCSKFLTWHLHQARPMSIWLCPTSRKHSENAMAPWTMTGNLYTSTLPSSGSSPAAPRAEWRWEMRASRSIKGRLPGVLLAFDFLFFFKVSFESHWLETRDDKASYLPEHSSSPQEWQVGT